MSWSKRERGKFISNRMQDLILHDLGSCKINAEQAGDIFDLLIKASRNKELFVSGVTSNMELAQNKYYKKAVAAWGKCLEIRKQQLRESGRI